MYRFKSWSDGDTNVQKTINLTKDVTLTAFYEEGEAVSPPSPINIIILMAIIGVGVVAVSWGLRKKK